MQTMPWPKGRIYNSFLLEIQSLSFFWCSFLLSGTEQRELRFVAHSPVVLHCTVTEGSGKPLPLTGARRHSSLAFISSFSALGKFLTGSHVPYYTVHSLYTSWPGMKQEIAQRVLHQWDPQVSSLFFAALRNWWTEWVSVDQENLWIRGFLWPW